MGEAKFDQPISEQIWNQKYRFKTERSEFENDSDVIGTWGRIASACSDQPRLHNNSEEKGLLEQRFFSALYDFKLLPAGRIISGAGTGRNVTLFNCYVMGTIPDSLIGIFDMLKEAALTMQQGGGIGYDFSTLRPKGASVKGVESFSSGPLTFMDVWDAMCKTIMSAGSRRGAMMATMRCDHPDIEEFIEAKRDPLRLRNFNVSVLCTDPFMEAVKNDADWDLHFNGVHYKTVKAKYLWKKILENTYNFAEPGVIFIDRINKTNNLHFIENIAATNPCGEQPLPPYGACLLGSVNLAKMISLPFTEHAEINMNELEKTTKTGVRLLDSVVDISKFPLEAQRQEALNKRRQGLGITGLADALFMCGIVYGSEKAQHFTENVLKNMAIWAYEESIEMARELGCAPVLETKKARKAFLESGFMKNMPIHIHEGIMEFGLRNTHLLSIAPTGTISMYAGNVSSGIEPIFAPSFKRMVTNDDGSGTKREEKVMDYAVLKFEEFFEDKDNPIAKNWWDNYMVTAQTLKPKDHILMQASAQKWVDSSISKTVNCPEDITFEDFEAVYMLAYETGCKGCTTYRPNDVTGSVLMVDEPKKEETVLDKEYDGDLRIMSRPSVIDGTTYKCRWGSDSFYVTFNNVIDPDHNWSMPFEIFINSKNTEHSAWIAALTRMISAVFQRGGDVRFVAEELKQIHDPKGGQWIDGRYCPSLVALIGQKLSEHLDMIGYQSTPEADDHTHPQEEETKPEPMNMGKVPDQCPSCKGFNVIKSSGCPTCQDCGYSKCG